MSEAFHPRYTPGGNLYFAETGLYDQSEYWRLVAQSRDGVDQQIKQAAYEYTDEEIEDVEIRLRPQLERIREGVYELTARYLTNIQPGIYEIGA